MIYPQVQFGSLVRRTTMAVSMIYLALLTACATPQVEYRAAKVPEPPRIERPSLESLNITSTMDAGSIIQAFRADIKRLQSTIVEYEKALEAYRKKDTK